MSFRSRVFLVVFAVFGLLLAALGLWARQELVRELRGSHAWRVEVEWRRARGSQEARGRDLEQRVLAVARHVERDSAFRLALLRRDAEERRRLVDYAEQLWALTGLDYLEIVAEDGTVLSSAHFRESHGAVRRGIAPGLIDGVAEVRVPLRGGATGAGWAAAEQVGIGHARYYVWGGIGLPLASESEGSGRLRTGGPDEIPSSDAPVEAAPVVIWRRIDLSTGSAQEVRDAIVIPDLGLERARESLDRSLFGALAASLFAALFLAAVVSRWIERPVQALIDKTLQVRVGREGVVFESRRSDEFGELGRFLESMVRRLRESSESLREAERRATLGDVARQVHHDVRNGVVPLRGVMRHLAQVAEDEPETLAAVFRERAATVDSGLEYLERLSTQYAKLTQRGPLQAVSVPALVSDLVRSWEVAHPRLRVEVALDPELPQVQAEELGLRRVLENLARNALDAMSGDGAAPERPLRVTLSAARVTRRDRSWVEIALRDEGPGMDEETLRRIFEPFYTTKPTGTGLGLSIVRRLVTDFGGSVDVESDFGVGTTFRLLLPVWGESLPLSPGRR